MSISEEIRLLVLSSTWDSGISPSVILEIQSYSMPSVGLLAIEVTPLSSVGVRPPGTAHLQRFSKGPVYHGLKPCTAWLACREWKIVLGVIENPYRFYISFDEIDHCLYIFGIIGGSWSSRLGELLINS